MSANAGHDSAFDPAESQMQIRLGDWLVQPQLNSLVHFSGEKRLIKPKAMDVLVCLARQPGATVSKQRLSELVWAGSAISDDVLAQAICDLRRALGDDAKNPAYIQTVPKRGYRLIAPVTAPEAVEQEPCGKLPAARLATVSWAALLVVALTLSQAGHHLSRPPGQEGIAATKTIAVLPFNTFPTGAEVDGMVQGFHDSLVVNLAKSLDVSIVSADSLIPSPSGPRPVGLLKGTLQRSGSRIRILLQLIDPSSQRLLWAHQFEGRADDLFMLQDRVATVTAQGLQSRLASGAIRPRPPGDDAYRAYLRARHLMSMGTRQSMQAAARLFRETIRLDPEYAGGYVGLAQSCLQRGGGFGQLTASEALEQAREAALKALDLQPGIAEAQAVLAAIEASRLRFRGAERGYQEALALNPGSAEIHSEYGLLLAALGRHEEAIRQTSLALELDPLSPEANAAHGQILLYAGHTKRAITQLLATLELEPEAVAPHYFLHWSYLKQGNSHAAQGAFFRFYELMGVSAEAISRLRTAYADGGVAGVAEVEIGWIERGHHSKIHSPVYRGRLYARAKDPQRAIDWLERAYKGDYLFGLEWLLVDPVYETLRPDPRFQRLLQRIGFPTRSAARSPVGAELENLRASSRSRN